MDFAQGELGLLPDIFWDMTWDEYERHAKGYGIRQAREWERTRFMTVTILNMFAEKGKSQTPQEFMPLITDVVDVKAIAMTEEKRREQQEFLDRMTANNFYQNKK